MFRLDVLLMEFGKFVCPSSTINASELARSDTHFAGVWVAREILLASAGLVWISRGLIGSLLYLNYMSIHHTIVFLAGHSPTGRYADRLGIPSKNFCMSGETKQMEETIILRTYKWLALVMKRRKFMSFHF